MEFVINEEKSRECSELCVWLKDVVKVHRKLYRKVWVIYGEIANTVE